MLDGLVLTEVGVAEEARAIHGDWGYGPRITISDCD
jgi:hypothetical protein